MHDLGLQLLDLVPADSLQRVFVLQVCQTIAEAFPGLREAVAWELLLAVLAVAQDATQEVRSLALVLERCLSPHQSERILS